MVKRPMTFGRAIVVARTAKGLSQKHLAALIHKEDDEGPVSPQYLNDIEHDRRCPMSDHLIRQFAQVLEEDEGYMFVLQARSTSASRSSRASRTSAGRSPKANIRRRVRRFTLHPNPLVVADDLPTD